MTYLGGNTHNIWSFWKKKNKTYHSRNGLTYSKLFGSSVTWVTFIYFCNYFWTVRVFAVFEESHWMVNVFVYFDTNIFIASFIFPPLFSNVCIIYLFLVLVCVAEFSILYRGSEVSCDLYPPNNTISQSFLTWQMPKCKYKVFIKQKIFLHICIYIHAWSILSQK